LQSKAAEGRHENLSLADAQKLLHQQQVHQIELEMQNEELRRVQEELKTIYDHAPVLMCVVDAHRQLLYANAAFAEFTGVPEAELKGGRACGVFGCVNALDDPRGCGYGTDCQNCALRVAMEDTLNTGIGHRNIEYTTTLVRDGERRNVSLLGSTARLQAGDQNHLLLCLHDITERKRMEAALRESEASLAKSQEIAHIGSWALDAVTNQLIWSDEVYRIFGLRPQEYTATYEGFLALVHPEDRAAVNTAYTASLRAGQDTYEIEHRVVWQNTGEIRYVHEKCIHQRNTSGQIVRSLGMVQDITERKQAEEQLRELTQRLTFHVDHSPLAVIEWGPDMRIIRWAGAADRIFGWKAEEVLGKRIEDFRWVYTKDEPQVTKVSTDLQTGTNSCCFSANRNYRKDGSVADCEWYNSSLLDATGQLRSVFSLVLDVTERKRAEAEREKLEAQNRQLQKSESLGRMAGAIAHHFNNQLAAVMMNLELVKNDVSQNAGFVANLSEALQSAHKAAEVSSLMLTYLGQTHSRHEPVDFAEVCRQHLPVLRATLAKDVELETDFSSPGPTITADSNQIQQVLSNLLTNAEEASGEEKGTIRLSVKMVSVIDIPSTRRFPIDYQPQEKNYACLEMADTGCGIAEEDIEKLFDPFYSTKFIGRGLGLPVVLGIVRAHQGVITVESRLGEGSVFRVFLPVSAEAVLKKPLPVAKALKPAGGGTVLVVDDENSVRNAMSKAFKYLGFTVLAAVDGAEAVEIFRAHQTEIRLVLCDLTMPRMNGWETLAALRQISPGIPVILTSGYSEVQAMAGKHSELPQIFLGKPCTLEELKDAVVRVMGK
jgi:PAS domain S-box-containing protein